jgi:hypothetical protein
MGRDLERSGCRLIEAASRNLFEGTEKNRDKTSVRIVYIPAKIRTEYYSNTSLERLDKTPLHQHTFRFEFSV